MEWGFCPSGFRLHLCWPQVSPPREPFKLMETRKRVSTAPSTSNMPGVVLPGRTGSCPFRSERGEKGTHPDSLLARMQLGSEGEDLSPGRE